jgi:hypothetical protein
MPSPLFPRFNRQQSQQKQALDTFRKTKTGQAVSRAARRYGGGQIPPDEMRRIIKECEDGIVRYGRVPLFTSLMNKLGSVGAILGAMIRPGGQAIGTAKQELEAAQGLLEAFGYAVKAPEKVEEPNASPPRPEYRVGGRPTPAPSPTQLEADDVQGPPSQPLTEGMIPVTSSNVHSIGYEWGNGQGVPGNLLVRFLGGSSKARSGPGPLYRYHNVPRSVFDAFKRAASKGAFVWDELRVRGTVSGHQYAYDLAGTGDDSYVPRQAGLKRGMAGEYYLQRSFKGRTSNLPERSVRRGNQPLSHWDKIKLKAGRRP